MTRERSHDLCQTGLRTRRVTFSICTNARRCKVSSFFWAVPYGWREQDNRKRKAAARSQFSVSQNTFYVSTSLLSSFSDANIV